jgi:hypothetical protein
MSLEFVTYAERPDLRRREDVNRLSGIWPDFMHHDPTANANFGRVRDGYPEFQILVLDGGQAVAEGNTVPVAWDGIPQPRGLDWALDTGSVADYATTLCALEAKIAPSHRGRQLSGMLIERMTSLVARHGLDGLIAPVRPTLKDRYPLTPIERYVEWRRADGELFDPWLRVHARLGAELLAVAPESMTILGSREDWEAWTDMVFPEDGEYVVPGALVPVRFESGRGLYVEPNVWMRHPV